VLSLPFYVTVVLETMEDLAAWVAQRSAQVGEMPEETLQQVREKAGEYEVYLGSAEYRRGRLAADMWTAAFFCPLWPTDDVTDRPAPTHRAFAEARAGHPIDADLSLRVQGLAEEHHFFHWPLEFPEVFEAGGFDVVLSNPPWERIKLQEQEFFATRDLDIAAAPNKAARQRLIDALPQTNPALAHEFEEAKHTAEAESKFVRAGGRFPLTAVGDVNTYALFAELARQLLNPDGSTGVIVPTGIATDDTYKHFFADLNDTYPNEFVAEERRFLPVYEGKMVQMYDHRAAGVEVRPDNVIRPAQPVPSTPQQLADRSFPPMPQLWVEAEEVTRRVPEGYKHRWVFAYKDVTASTNERTCVVCVLPNLAVAYTLRAVFVPGNIPIPMVCCLIATMGSLVYDYLCRQALSGLHLSDYIVKQLPILPPTAYTPADVEFIAPRVLELVYTAWDLKPFAEDLGYQGEPFRWDEERRAVLRAELDACYARLYGLTEEELRYILDPRDIYGEDFPGETFRVLKEKEIKQFGEYRTRRLVLEAWGRQGGENP
jgi:hypothetical protein